MKLLILDNFDGVDLREINAFPELLEALIPVVIKAVIKDHEVPFLPKGDEP